MLEILASDMDYASCQNTVNVKGKTRKANMNATLNNPIQGLKFSVLVTIKKLHLIISFLLHFTSFYPMPMTLGYSDYFIEKK